MGGFGFEFEVGDASEEAGEGGGCAEVGAAGGEHGVVAVVEGEGVG